MEYLSFAIFVIFDLKRQLNSHEIDQVLTFSIFPLQWVCFPIKTSRIAQWIHLFPINLDDSRQFL